MKEKIFALVCLIFLASVVFAEPTPAEVLAPLNKIQLLVQAGLSVLAIIALSMAGAMYFFAGNNLQARDNAKNMFTYAVIGLIIVNVAPLLVSYLIPV